MPKEKKKKLPANRSILLASVLLPQFFLTKIGQVAFYLIKSFIIVIWLTAKKIFHALKSYLHLGHMVTDSIKETVQNINVSPTFVVGHRRGRPRKHNYFIFAVKKFRRETRRRFFSLPKTTRLSIILSTLAVIIFFYTFLAFQTANALPSPSKIVTQEDPLTTEFYDRNGKLLYRLYEGKNRTLVNLDEISPYLKEGTIAIEDKNFYHHPGVDPTAIVRAAYNNIMNNQDQVEGASTLTQQLIKNTLLTPEKTYTRKIKEALLAFWAERIYSKDQILQMYLNEAPYGGPAWGVEAASEMYFGKHAKDLNLAESAYLAGLPASPTEFSPYGTHPDMGVSRQHEVLRRMVEEGYINKKQADDALTYQLGFQPPRNDIQAPHFVMYVKDLLSKKYGPRVVSQGGLKVYTTLDLSLQKQAEKIVGNEINSLGYLHVTNGAAMVTDPKTGQILAMVGSKDYFDPNFGSYNVTTALRQPGSSIKVITYATAFKNGFNPGNTVLDVPTTFTDEWGNTYKPVNYDGQFHGPVSIRTALASSINIPAVKILATVGLPKMIQTAKDMGITTFNDPQNYGLSLTLGAADVKMVDMMEVYGTLASNGVAHTPTPILKVEDSKGNVVEQYRDNSHQAIAPGVAYMLSSILSDNKARSLAFGTNSPLSLPGHTVGVKTGTSDNKRDNWTFGYTPDYVVGVWVGNNDNSPMNPRLSSGITGAAPIWHNIMADILTDTPDIAFKRPDDVIDRTVDGRRDLSLIDEPLHQLVRVSHDKDKIVFADAFSYYATPSATASPEDGGADGTKKDQQKQKKD